ncbi:MAG: aminotransferase class I/II-fold pyridoxal phosphate-dependent enzyme [Chloroflexi bacterium]|nr:aminotransferase class I/II-fold pyridoxal phosphate-dependent enzyme [Chloroflexota bacterium]
MPRFDPARALRPALRALRGYVPIEPAEEAAQRHGVPADGVVKLDGNENPYGPSPKALAALAGAYPAHRYPDPDQRRLRAALARRHAVPPECIVAGAGSDELIDLVFRAYVEPGDRVVVASPTFGMYGFDAELHGARLIDVPRGEDWSLDAEPLLAAAAEAKVVFIPSPNNPTGDVLPPSLVDSLLEQGALVVVDEAYIEFAHASSLAPRAADGDPLIVLRTFSKWAGLAGLRVGYGVMPREIAQTFMRVKQPYGVSVAAEIAALASLEDAALLDERACTIAGERDRRARTGGLDMSVMDAGHVGAIPSEQGRAGLAHESVCLLYVIIRRANGCRADLSSSRDVAVAAASELHPRAARSNSDTTRSHGRRRPGQSRPARQSPREWERAGIRQSPRIVRISKRQYRLDALPRGTGRGRDAIRNRPCD